MVGGCSKSEQPVAVMPDTPAEQPKPVSSVVVVPEKTPPTVAAPIPVKQPEWIAPPGVFYLLVRKSVVRESGIIGYPPGTRLTLIEGNRFSVGSDELTVSPEERTNDVRIASGFATVDAQRQREIAERSAAVASRAAAAASAAEERAAAAARPTAVPGAPPPLSMTVVPSSTPPPVSAGRAPAAPKSGPLLGASHTRVMDGFYWEKDASGTWRKVRPVNP
jgi:hypothetical protein